MAMNMLGRDGAPVFNGALSAFAAASAAFAIFAMPETIFSSLIAMTGLPALIPAAEPPLGATARLAAIAIAVMVTFLAVWLLLGAIDRAAGNDIADADGHAEDDEDLEWVMPRVRRADAHPDAPARRPLFAGQDLGEPVDQPEIEADSDDFMADETDDENPQALDALPAFLARSVEADSAPLELGPWAEAPAEQPEIELRSDPDPEPYFESEPEPEPEPEPVSDPVKASESEHRDLSQAEPAPEPAADLETQIYRARLEAEADAVRASESKRAIPDSDQSGAEEEPVFGEEGFVGLRERFAGPRGRTGEIPPLAAAAFEPGEAAEDVSNLDLPDSEGEEEEPVFGEEGFVDPSERVIAEPVANEATSNDALMARLALPEDKGESISNLFDRLDAGLAGCEWPLAPGENAANEEDVDPLRSALDDLQKMAARRV